jgi:hypothetical protein
LEIFSRIIFHLEHMGKKSCCLDIHFQSGHYYYYYFIENDMLSGNVMMFSMFQKYMDINN